MRRAWIALMLLAPPAPRLSSGLALSAVEGPAAASAPRGFVHASGTMIVDGAGKELLLRGVNLGAWLLWESYLFRFPGDDLTESRMRRALVERHGEKEAYAFFRAWRERYVTRADIRRIKQLGWNVVRIPFNARILTDDPFFDLRPEEGWALLDRALDWCEAEGVYAVLDLHSAPGGQNGGGITDTELKRGLFAGDSVTRYREETAALWGKIAARYRGRTVVAAYDLLNEPAVPWEEGGTDAVVDVYRRVIPAVRAADPGHLIMVEGNWYATDFGAFKEPLDPNLCYQFHKYWNDTRPGSISGYLELRERMRAPVWLGETGENRTEWYERCVRLMEDHRIGWCFWPWKRAGGGCVQEIVLPPDWTRTPGGMRALADALPLAKCREDRAVVAALRGRVPAEPADPPGTIRVEAEDYLPGEGTGYHDSEPENQGHAYREHEGVDVFLLPDGSGWGVGWIIAGEWLAWSVTVPAAGAYTLLVRTASPDGGGAFALSLDGRPLAGPLRPPKTGGWDRWTAWRAPAVPLPRGVHRLRFEALAPGFNLDALRFVPASGTRHDDSP